MTAQKRRTPESTRRGSKARPVPARQQLRVRKRYRMRGNIPKRIDPTTTGYAILTEIQKHKGQATFERIRARLPRVPLPTIRFYLGKFQRDKIIAGA